MTLSGLTIDFRRFLDVRPGEAARIGFMAAFLFFLLAANNVIKIVRDSLFLSRFPITELPYAYLMAAAFAAVLISIYSRYTSRLSLSQVILGSHAFIISNVIIFWLLIAFYDFGWVLYAFFIWSAIVGLVAVAQFWTLINDMFNPREAKRLFGILTAAGTLGGMMGGFAANWAVRFLFGTTQLLWLIVVLFAAAFSVTWFAFRERERIRAENYRANVRSSEIEERDGSGVLGTLWGSRYLQTIAALVFVSVIVSTLIDYQFKAAAKEAYPSTDALAGFFGSYYAWLSVVTVLTQLLLTGRLLLGLGLTPSLLLLPVTLFAGSISLLVWPGLFAATATRLAEASLRTSVNHSGVEILYLPIPDFIKKKVKVFLDVTVERLGDGTAALIILFYTLFLGGSELTLLSYFSIGLIVIWLAVVLVVQGGYLDALRRGLAYREVSLATARIDVTDKATLEVILSHLDGKDEQSVLFGLDLAEKFDPKLVVARLPRGLLNHPSAEVRRRALTLMAASLDSNVLAVVFELLTTDSAQVRSEAINTVATVLKEAEIPIIRPFLKSPEGPTRRAAIRLMLQSGDARIRQEAFADFHELMTDGSPEGAQNRVEAARLMGELVEPEFSNHLGKLIRDDPAPAVRQEAMAAAARGKYSRVIPDILSRLSSAATKTAAREALVQYGEMAVKELRSALYDSRVSPDIRLNIPQVLSKIQAQSAMNALQGGLLDEDRSLRFKVILAIEEMARRFPDLKVDQQIIESAIMSDAVLYSQRFTVFSGLFGPLEKSSDHGESLLYFALMDSMERVKERVMWLLALLYPAQDIRRAWSALNSTDPLQRAHATEFLDNLLTGDLKGYVFPLYSDGQPGQRLRMALASLGIDSIDTDSALRMLLTQDDRWLKAATVWEIGIRKLFGFRDMISKLVDSDDAVLRETASQVMQRI